MLTIQVEQLGNKLGEPRANPIDLAAAANFIRAMPDSTNEQFAEIKREWLPYIEGRLAAIGDDGGSRCSVDDERSGEVDR